MILVELLNSTFENEPSSNRDSNVEFAPLAHVLFEWNRSHGAVQCRCSADSGLRNAKTVTASVPSPMGLPDSHMFAG
jgi:hypothetical protein